MNKKCTPFYYLFLLFWGSLSLTQAQEELTLKEAIAIAIKENVDINKGINSVEQLKHDKLRATMSLLPNVNASGNLNSTTGTNFDQTTGVLRTETGEYVNGNITVSWDILNVLNKYSEIQRAKFSHVSEASNYAYTKDFVVLNVVGRYVEILQAIRQDEIFSKFCEIQEQNVNRVKEMIEVGALPGQDFYTQNAEWSRLKSLKEDNLNVLNTKKNALMLLLQLDPATELAVTEELGNNLANETQDIAPLYEVALAERKDLKSLEATERTRKYQVSLNRSAYIPRLSLFYSYGSRYSSFQIRDFEDQFFKDNIMKTYGLSIQIPIFNGLQSRNVVYKSKRDHENAVFDVDQFKKSIYVELSNLQNTIAANTKKKVYRHDQYESAKRAYELEQERYYLGQGNPLDLGLAQRNFVEASLLENQIHYQLLYNSYELLFFTGRISTIVEN